MKPALITGRRREKPPNACPRRSPGRARAGDGARDGDGARAGDGDGLGWLSVVYAAPCHRRLLSMAAVQRWIPVIDAASAALIAGQP